MVALMNFVENRPDRALEALQGCPQCNQKLLMRLLPLLAYLADPKVDAVVGDLSIPILTSNAFPRAGKELPVCEAVAALLDGRITLGTAIGMLLSRPRRDE